MDIETILNIVNKIMGFLKKVLGAIGIDALLEMF